MKSRPITLVFITLMLLIAGANLVLRHPPTTAAIENLLETPVTFVHVLVGLGFLLTAIGIWSARTSAYYGFLFTSSLWIGVEFSAYMKNPQPAHYGYVLAGSLLAAWTAYQLNKHLFAPYFNPRVYSNTPREHRFLVSIESRLLLDGNIKIAKLVDISSGGCFLLSTCRAVPGEQIEVQWTSGGHSFQAMGKVAWINSELKGFGVMFTDFKEGSPQTLKRVLIHPEIRETLESSSPANPQTA